MIQLAHIIVALIAIYAISAGAFFGPTMARHMDWALDNQWSGQSPLFHAQIRFFIWLNDTPAGRALLVIAGVFLLVVAIMSAIT